MKCELYDILNNPKPTLRTIKSFNVHEDVFQYDTSIVEFLNRSLQIDKLSAEHIYALSLDASLTPKGLILVSIGKCDSCELNMKALATGLLLTGAEQFMCFHNHPGGSKTVSYNDRVMTNRYRELGQLLDISFLKHIMITQGYYTICEDVDESGYVFGTKVDS